MAIPVTLSFATADGAFAEQWPVTLLAESTTRVTAYTQVDVADLEGSYSVTELDPSRFARVLAIVQLTFENGAWTGTLSGQGITAGSSDPNSATSANAASFRLVVAANTRPRPSGVQVDAIVSLPEPHCPPNPAPVTSLDPARMSCG